MTEKNLYLDLSNEEQSISIKLAIAAADFKKAPAETERLTSGHGGILGTMLEKVARVAKKACCIAFNPVPYGRAYSCVLLCGNTPKQTAVKDSKWFAHVVAMSYAK